MTDFHEIDAPGGAVRLAGEAYWATPKDDGTPGFTLTKLPPGTSIGMEKGSARPLR